MADVYLNQDNCFQRLYTEYKKHKSIIVGYDFDDTVFDFHNAGHEYDDVINLLRRAKGIGCYLIIITGNPNTEFIKNYCRVNYVPYDAINTNAPFLVDDARKIYTNIMLDDRAGLRSAFDTLLQLIQTVEVERERTAMIVPAKQVVFVAAPFYSDDKDVRRERTKIVAHYCQQLLKQGICCLSPVIFGTKVLDFYELPANFEFWEKLSYQYLDLSTEVHVLRIDVWDKFKGLSKEIEYATKLKLPILYKGHYDTNRSSY